MSGEKILVAIPEGKLFDEVLPMLQASGLYLGGQQRVDSEGTLESPFSEVSVRVVAPQNVPRMLSNKNDYADICVVSSEVFLEEWVENWRYARDLNVAKRRLSLITKSGTQIDELDSLHVATGYPLVTEAYVSAMDVELKMSCESLGEDPMVMLEKADAVVDVIDSDTPLSASGLKEVLRICPVSAHALVSTHVPEHKYDQVKHVLDRMLELSAIRTGDASSARQAALTAEAV